MIYLLNLYHKYRERGKKIVSDWRKSDTKYLYKRKKMVKSLIQCTVILAITFLMAAQPSEVSQEPFDHHLRSDQSNGKNTQKTEEIQLKINQSTSLFGSNSNSFNYFEQPKKINKIASNTNENIGAISEKEFKLLCDLVAAEAENQPIEGKRAVVAVVLNRMEYGSPFGDSIEEVIFQKNQFSCISDGRFFQAEQYVSEEDREAVAAELKERSDYKILYFTAYKYGKYGTPAYKIADHYFCTN